ncbi:MAG: hypothetical protein JNK49_10690 [Planctomycetes bacterium]|nr:hypothetical protein [Planctomycetota bacterium]
MRRSILVPLSLVAACVALLALAARWRVADVRDGDPAAAQGGVVVPAPRVPVPGTGLPTASGGGGHLAAAVVPQGHVYTGIADEPDDVGPFTAAGSTARRYVLGFTHEALLDTDPRTGALRGALAEQWGSEPELPGARFVLRDGVRFADGSEVTMADVLFGFELARAGHLQFGFAGDAFTRVQHAEAVDARTLRVTFRAQDPGALRAVAESWLVTSRRRVVDAVAALAQRLGQPEPAVDSAAFAALLHKLPKFTGPGTGPYALPSEGTAPRTWQSGQELLLERNEHHWRRFAEPGCWNFAAIRLLFRDRAAAPAELFAHRVDWYYEPDCELLLQRRPELAEHYRPFVYDHPAQGVLGMLWNCERPPLDRQEVRVALGRLFDRAAMVQVYRGKAVPAVALAKPSVAEYPHDLTPLPFDPAHARAALRDAGFDPAAGTALRLQVLAPVGDPQIHQVLALFGAACRAAGVDVTLRELEFPAFVAQKASGAWDGVLAVRGLRPWGDPFDFVHSRGADNDGHWRDATADRLAEAVRGTVDPVLRGRALRALHERVHEAQPLALLVHPQVAILFEKHIEGAVPGPRGLWPERCWMPEAFQRR